MTTALITLSKEGYYTLLRIKTNSFANADVFVPEKLYKTINDNIDKNIYHDGLLELVTSIFNRYRCFIFVMPLGVVVRVISPNLRNKYDDPAIITVDVRGRWVISTLSGHEGGANELAEEVALILNSEPIITTSTEAKKDLIIGLGMKRGITDAIIGEAINIGLKKVGKSLEDVRLIATVDRKKKERGLLKFCNDKKIPLRSISIYEIKNSRIKYSESKFVKKVMGIGAVAEPAALLAGSKTKIILERIKWKGVTVVVAQENYYW